MALRPIAIFLPQFHPVKENNEWWGKGFTEWTNVAKAKPLFKGHYQPHLPTDLGYYDLRLAETRAEQARMAKENGIHGFCYYHYWFAGKRILELPVEEIFKSKEPDFPFMLCWANENWTRKWDGGSKHILLEQNYTAEDALSHIQSLIPLFKDPRYIRVDNKPVFSFYRTGIIPNLEEYVRIFREEAAKHDMELYLCRFYGFQDYETLPYFDASVEFQPFTKTMDDYVAKVLRTPLSFLIRSTAKTLKTLGIKRLSESIKLYNRPDYNDYVDFVMENYEYPPHDVLYPGVMPSWDNTARRGHDAYLFRNANPEKFQQWLQFHEDKMIPHGKEENFIFINAWNEWAEGNHLEPCAKWGSRYLHAVRNVFKGK